MSKIDEYRSKQVAISRAKKWAGLIGKEYHGGGGGLGKLTGLTVKATVYHQERDGATNYHDAPDDLRFAIEREIRFRFMEILEGALSAMDTQSNALAKLAHAEHAELMRAAGLVQP